MTGLIKDDIPNQITTIEQLHAWSGLVLGYLHPQKSIVEAAGENAERVVQTFVLRADDGTERLITRTALPLNPDWTNNDTDAFWLMANELGAVDLPAAYTNV